MKRSKMLGVAMAGVLGWGMAAQGAVLVYSVTLDGPSESPANASPGTGTGTITYNDTAHTLRVQQSFSGLTGTTTASHIHASTATPFTGTAGVATTTPSFVGFPLGVTSGSMDQTYDLTLASSYNASYVSANGGTPATAEVALTTAFAQGRAYLNVHTSTFGGGEIRGFLVAVPEPASLGVVGAGAALLMARRRR